MTLLAELPQPRGYLSASFSLAGELYVAGGCGQAGQPVADFDAFDTRASMWRPLPPLPTARSNLALAHVLG